MMKRRIVKGLVMSLISSLFCGWAYGQSYTGPTVRNGSLNSINSTNSIGRSTAAIAAVIR